MVGATGLEPSDANIISDKDLREKRKSYGAESGTVSADLLCLARKLAGLTPTERDVLQAVLARKNPEAKGEDR